MERKEFTQIEELVTAISCIYFLTKCGNNAHSNSEIKNISLTLIPVSCISVCFSMSSFYHPHTEPETTSKVPKTQLLSQGDQLSQRDN